MSLSDRKIPGAKIATLDIERVPGRARIEHRGLTIEGDFWDLSGWKYKIGRRIRPDEVLEWPRSICAAWRWKGTRPIHFAAEWEDGGRHTFLETVWGAYDQADILRGHNIRGFDSKKLKGEWWLMGLNPPSAYKTVDTLTIARREFGLESNTLAALLARLGLPGKVDRYDPEVAKAACAGDKAAQRRITRYNRGDVPASELLCDALTGWDTTHPHLGLYNGKERSCNQCGGTEFTATGLVRAVTNSYAGYRCDNCGANLRNNYRKGTVTMRAAR